MSEIRHIGIVTQNIDRLKPTYEALGFKKYYDAVESVRVVKMKSKNSVIELLQYESQSNNNLRRAGISHIAFTVDKDGNFLELIQEVVNAY